MKRYNYYINQDGKRECYVVTYREVDRPSECSICRALNSVLSADFPVEDKLSPQLTNLAAANLRRHLKSGKHWKRTNEQVRKIFK